MTDDILSRLRRAIAMKQMVGGGPAYRAPIPQLSQRRHVGFIDPEAPPGPGGPAELAAILEAEKAKAAMGIKREEISARAREAAAQRAHQSAIQAAQGTLQKDIFGLGAAEKAKEREFAGEESQTERAYKERIETLRIDKAAAEAKAQREFAADESLLGREQAMTIFDAKKKQIDEHFDKTMTSEKDKFDKEYGLESRKVGVMEKEFEAKGKKTETEKLAEQMAEESVQEDAVTKMAVKRLSPGEIEIIKTIKSKAPEEVTAADAAALHNMFERATGSSGLKNRLIAEMLGPIDYDALLKKFEAGSGTGIKVSQVPYSPFSSAKSMASGLAHPDTEKAWNIFNMLKESKKMGVDMKDLLKTKE